jgi:hypothetical protein
MEPEGSSPCSQKPAIGPYPEPAESSSPTDLHLPNVHLNVILPPTPRSSMWSLTFGPPNQNPVTPLPSPMRVIFPYCNYKTKYRIYVSLSTLCSLAFRRILPHTLIVTERKPESNIPIVIKRKTKQLI